MSHDARKIFQKSENFFEPPADAEKYWAYGVFFGGKGFENAGRCGKIRRTTRGIGAKRAYFTPISPIPKLNQSGRVITAAIDVASTICTAIFG